MSNLKEQHPHADSGVAHSDFDELGRLFAEATSEWQALAESLRDLKAALEPSEFEKAIEHLNLPDLDEIKRDWNESERHAEQLIVKEEHDLGTGPKKKKTTSEANAPATPSAKVTRPPPSPEETQIEVRAVAVKAEPDPATVETKVTPTCETNPPTPQSQTITNAEKGSAKQSGVDQESSPTPVDSEEDAPPTAPESKVSTPATPVVAAPTEPTYTLEQAKPTQSAPTTEPDPTQSATTHAPIEEKAPPRGTQPVEVPPSPPTPAHASVDEAKGKTPPLQPHESPVALQSEANSKTSASSSPNEIDSDIRDRLSELAGLMKEHLSKSNRAVEQPTVAVPQDLTLKIATEVASRVKASVVETMRDSKPGQASSDEATHPPATETKAAKKIPIDDIAAMIDQLSDLD